MQLSADDSRAQRIATTAAVTEVLRHINSLYTVLFTRSCCSTARGASSRHSRPRIRRDVGCCHRRNLGGGCAPPIQEPRRTACPGSARARCMAGSQRTSSRPQSVPTGGRSIGGIAVVFDHRAPNSLPCSRMRFQRTRAASHSPDAPAVFLDRDLRVLASTNPAIDIARLEWIRQSARTGEAQVMRIGDEYHSVGAKTRYRLS